jgi:hypothetical protein
VDDLLAVGDSSKVARVVNATNKTLDPRLADRRPLCILHVGPHKTGTTTLQELLSKRASMLRYDGWHQLPQLPPGWAGVRHFTGHKNGANLALYLQQARPNASQPVWKKFESWVNARARSGDSIVLSSEEFDRPSVHIAQLARVLAPFRTTVVVGHRLLYDWTFSVWREISGHYNGTMRTWIQQHGQSIHGFYTNSVVRSYAWHFEDIRILDLTPTIANIFVCSHLRAPLTCASLSEDPPKSKNVRRGPPHTRDAVCATQGGCLGQSIRAWLLEQTIKYEMEISLLLRPPSSVNETALGLQLDALGVCFCES